MLLLRSRSVQDFHLLCPDVLPEDRQLRDDLRKAKLEKLLLLLERERNDQQHVRNCLFCREFPRCLC